MVARSRRGERGPVREQICGAGVRRGGHNAGCLGRRSPLAGVGMHRRRGGRDVPFDIVRLKEKSQL